MWKLWMSSMFISLLSHVAMGQIWVGNDNFDSNSLDSSKWTFSGSSLPNFPANLIKTSTDFSFSSTNQVGDQYGVIFWKEKLPMNVDWTATIQATINSSYLPSTSGGYVEALISVIQDMDTFSNYFTQTLHRNIQTSISTDWAISGLSSFVAEPVSFDSALLKLDFHSSTKTLTASYSANNNPNNLMSSATIDVNSWRHGGDLTLAVGGYSSNSTISPGLLNIDNFNLVPEPSALSLLAVGLGVVLRRRRRTV